MSAPALIRMSDCPAPFTLFNQLYYRYSSSIYKGVAYANCLIVKDGNSWHLEFVGSGGVIGVTSSETSNTESPLDVSWDTTGNSSFVYTSTVTLSGLAGDYTGANQDYEGDFLSGFIGAYSPDDYLLRFAEGNYEFYDDNFSETTLVNDGDTNRCADIRNPLYPSSTGCWTQSNGGGTPVVTVENTAVSFVPSFARVDIAIDSAEELQAIKTNSLTLAGSYTQTSDISLSTIANWIAIGTSAAPFTGSYDGRGYSITNFVINRATTDYIGLFGAVNSTSIIQNITLVSPTVTGRDHVGSLIGKSLASDFTIRNCTVRDATIVGRNFVGGLMGWAEGGLGIVEDCIITGTLTGTIAGLFVGIVYGTVFNRCGATGAIVASSAPVVGGFCGQNTEGRFTNCFSRVSFSGETGTRGSFAGADITPDTSNTWFQRCYAESGLDNFIASVSELDSVHISDCYFLGTDDSDSFGATGKTAAKLKLRTTFRNWNFKTVWGDYAFRG